MGVKGESFIKIFNVAIGFLGLLMVAYGGYQVYLTKQLNVPAPEITVYGPLAAGVVVCVVALLGSAGISKRKKSLLAAHFVSLFLVAGVVMFMAAVALAYVGAIGDFDGSLSSLNNTANSLTEKAEKTANDVQLAVWNKCCFEGGFSDIEIFKCDSPEACTGQEADNGTCACYFDDTFQSQLGDIDQDNCEILQDFTLAGAPVVGNLTDDGCGGGSPTEYQKRIYDFIAKYAGPASYAFIAIGVIFLLELVAIVVCVCDKEFEWEDEEDDPYGRTVRGKY